MKHIHGLSVVIELEVYLAFMLFSSLVLGQWSLYTHLSIMVLWMEFKFLFCRLSIRQNYDV